MRRALFAIGGLAAGTTLLVVVKGAPAGTPAQELAAGSASAPQTRTESPEPSGTPAGGGAGKTKAGKAPAKKAPTGTFQVTGPVVSNDYGDVQVRVTITNGKLTDVQALQMPASSARSEQLSARVARDMAAEAIDSGRAKQTLAKLVAITNSPPPVEARA